MHLLRRMSGLWRNINERTVSRCKQIEQRNIHTFSKLKGWPVKKKQKTKAPLLVIYILLLVLWVK